MKRQDTKNLLKDSRAYHDKNDYYEKFSQAEDGEGKVRDYLIKKANCGVILDAGCGTGKFLKVLENNSNKYIGVDLSIDQLVKAKSKSCKENSIFINANLQDIMLGDNTVDLVISSWVLGTVTDLEERNKCLSELKRVLKPGGEIILIENEVGSEFEYLRGRDKDIRTSAYNQWIKNNGFVVEKVIETYFDFKNMDTAKKCFLEIYGEEVMKKITSEKIGHKISIFKFEK